MQSANTPKFAHAMVQRRVAEDEGEKIDDLYVAILGEAIRLPKSGRVTKNRFLKVCESSFIDSQQRLARRRHSTSGSHCATRATTKVSARRRSGNSTVRQRRGESCGTKEIQVYERFGVCNFGIIVVGRVAIADAHVEAPGDLLICKERDSPARRRQFARFVAAGNSGGGGSLFLAQLAATDDTQRFARGPRARFWPQSTICSNDAAIGADSESVPRLVFAAQRAKEAGERRLQPLKKSCERRRFRRRAAFCVVRRR